MTAAVELAPGTVFAGDFRVVRALAAGGMGALYVVDQLSTGQRRALKVIRPELADQERNRERFIQEARLGAQIDSAHVVQVIAAGVDEHTRAPWLVMELLEGQDLGDWMRARTVLAPAEVHAIFAQLGDALARAHALGIIHRDLKPENVFLATPGAGGAPFRVKVLDFGIAKMVVKSAAAGATVTSTLGSPVWMAPEQATMGARVRPATDVWALGLIAFYLLTGWFYWTGANGEHFNLSSLLVEVMIHPLAPASARAAQYASERRLPPGFDAWFARCVHRDPTARYANGGDAVAALLPLLAAMAPGDLPAASSTEAMAYATTAPAGRPASPVVATITGVPQAAHAEPSVAGDTPGVAQTTVGAPAWPAPPEVQRADPPPPPAPPASAPVVLSRGAFVLASMAGLAVVVTVTVAITLRC